jgi:polyhydroxyalkanoate synthesis repressor PhaR
MSEARIIKKYPNRRLYDTVESRYITLEDIRRLVLAQIEFIVLDKKTQEDITRSILLQVIAEQEHGGEPMMSEDFLSQVIRSYGGTMQSLVASYLEQSLKLFMTQQSQIRDRMRSVVGLDPMSAMTSMAQDNYARFRQMQDAFFQSMLSAGQPRQGRDEESKP